MWGGIEKMWRVWFEVSELEKMGRGEFMRKKVEKFVDSSCGLKLFFRTKKEFKWHFYTQQKNANPSGLTFYISCFVYIFILT